MILLVLFLVALTSCRGGGSTDARPGTPVYAQPNVTLEIVMDDMRFRPDHIVAQAGDTTEILLRNPDSMPHDLTIDDLGGQRVKFELRPGTEVTFSLTMPNEAGEWEFYCSVPGHRDLGMEGILEVTD